MTLLRAEGLVRRYPMRTGMFGRSVDVVAVDRVSIALRAGETLGLVGESGCGKSTTGRLVLGLEPPDGGTVAFQGRPMPPVHSAAWRAMRARMQLVFQDPLAALDRRMTIAAQIAEPQRIHGGNARVDTLLREVGLRPDHGARYPHELSGGQRQRAVLARALATDPDLLVCDETISALDVSVQAQVMNLLSSVQAQRGMAMLFISHDLRAVRQVSHRIAVMYLGRIVEEGTPDQVLRDPRHPYAQALVSAIPHPARRTRRILLAGDPPNPVDRPSGCAFHPRCPVAVARCAHEAPQMRPLREPGRAVACHLAAAAEPAEAA